MNKITPNQLARQVISHFVESPVWSKEMAIFKKLFKKYENITFWQDLMLENSTKFPSLACFMTPKAFLWLDRKYSEISLEKVLEPSYNVAGTKFGQDYQGVAKPRSVLDFLK